MTRALLLPLFMAICGMADLKAQHSANATDVPCALDASNRMTPLYSDSLCSVALICIPRSVEPHYHRHHTEHVSILQGNARMLLGGDSLEIGPGDVISIPSGTPHAVWNIDGGPLKVMSVHTPAFDGKDRVPWTQ